MNAEVNNYLSNDQDWQAEMEELRKTILA